jgi:hypothetical protein
MNIAECIVAICNFPLTYKNANMSPSAIFTNSKYGDQYEFISLEALEEHVKAHPELIDRWILYSQDKRWTPAWAFTKNKSDGWVVSYIQESGKHGYEIIFGNATNACAFMIKMEFEELRLMNKYGRGA